MQSTRQQILDYLEKLQTASANEISRALHMTAANARHHLGLLMEQKQVEVIQQQKARGRGRPARLYTLAHSAMQDNLDVLVSALLKLLLKNSASDPPFQSMIPLVFGEIPGGKNTPQRLNAIIQRLNELNYRARWEAAPSGPRVIFRHCPYASVLAENPQLCQMDTAALASLLGAPVEQLAQLERDSKGLVSCIFAAIPR